jgi:hypothetical protein
MPMVTNPDGFYIVREQQAGWQYSGDYSPSHRKIIKGVGPVFRNKMKQWGYVIMENTDHGNYREAMFEADHQMKNTADAMFFGTSKRIEWDPVGEEKIMTHRALAPMRNLEVLNLHLKEVIDALTLGIGEVPKVKISSGSYYTAGNDSAELSYDHVTVTVQLKNALR